MEIIQAPNNFSSTDFKDRIFIYLAGKSNPELIDYIRNNIANYSIKFIEKMVIFNPSYDLENKSEEEKKSYFKWEEDNIKRSDIFVILLDNNEKYFYQLGKYLSFFYDIYKNNINEHFIIGYTGEFKNVLYLKSQVDLTVKGLVTPIEIKDMPSYGNEILKKLEKLYKITEHFIDHKVIDIEQEHYWSTNLGPKITKIFCQAPWPEVNFTIGITGLFGIGKSSIYHWFSQGRFLKTFESYIGGIAYRYEVEINNKKFKLDFEDTGSQERFGNYQYKRLKMKSCVIFVFDITNRASFDEIKNNIYPAVKFQNKNLFNVLIGSKLDLKYERNITYEEADTFSEENNMKYFEVSAKSGENMERLCNYIYNKFSKY